MPVRPQPGNWVRLEDDAESVLVRRYFDTPQNSDPLPMSISLVDDAPERAPIDPADLARGLIGSGLFVRETAKVWGGWYADVRRRNGANSLRPLSDEGDLMTPAGMTYLEGTWELDAGQALVLRFDPPDVPYWGFLPMNIWMESFDWRVAPVTLNNFGAIRDADGSVTVILSEQDPGRPNWLATLGHRRGLMSLRLARLGDRSAPRVEASVVPIDSLREPPAAGEPGPTP